MGPPAHLDRSCPSHVPERSPTSISFLSGRRGASEFVPATAAGGSRTPYSTVPWPTRGHSARRRSRAPVDNEGKKLDLTMAYVGTRRLFERAGFTKASDTDAVSGGFARVVMRLNLH